MFKVNRLSAEIFAKLWEFRDHEYNPYFGLPRIELALSRELLDSLVLTRLQNLLKYACNNNSYYNRVFRDQNLVPEEVSNIEVFKQIPCLKRDNIKNVLEGINSPSFTNTKMIKSATGGTTSSPISFYLCQNSLWHRTADTVALDEWYGRYTGDKVAYLWGAKQDFIQKQTFGMFLRNITYMKRLFLPGSPLSDTIMENYLERLDKWKPIFLQAYPTPLYEFCLFLKRKGRNIPYIKSASVTAEPLFGHQRKVIEEILGLKVFDWYGSRELGRIASECECHDGFHINEPSVFVEVEPDPSLPEGFGHLIITDLWNKAMPFIRYKTGDIAMEIDCNCCCGRALKRIGRIEGRLVDTILLKGDRRVPGVSLTNRIVKDCSEILELQIVQRTIDTFVLRYVKGPRFSNISLQDLALKLKEHLEAEIIILFEEVIEIPRSASGKSRFVISEINNVSSESPVA